jgi:hypothetical protein
MRRPGSSKLLTLARSASTPGEDGQGQLRFVDDLVRVHPFELSREGKLRMKRPVLFRLTTRRVS